jgi:hypothetical protein
VPTLRVSRYIHSGIAIRTQHHLLATSQILLDESLDQSRYQYKGFHQDSGKPPGPFEFQARGQRISFPSKKSPETAIMSGPPFVDALLNSAALIESTLIVTNTRKVTKKHWQSDQSHAKFGTLFVGQHRLLGHLVHFEMPTIKGATHPEHTGPKDCLCRSSSSASFVLGLKLIVGLGLVRREAAIPQKHGLFRYPGTPIIYCPSDAFRRPKVDRKAGCVPN